MGIWVPPQGKISIWSRRSRSSVGQCCPLRHRDGPGIWCWFQVQGYPGVHCLERRTSERQVMATPYCRNVCMVMVLTFKQARLNDFFFFGARGSARLLCTCPTEPRGSGAPVTVDTAALVVGGDHAPQIFNLLAHERKLISPKIWEMS